MPNKLFDKVNRIGLHTKFGVVRTKSLSHKFRVRSFVVSWVPLKADTECLDRTISQLSH